MSEVNNILAASAGLVTMDKAAALAAFEQYKDAVRRSHSAADQMMVRTFKALSLGYGVLNVQAAIQKAGVHPQTYMPRLAISRADQEKVFFKRWDSGAGAYSYSSRHYLSSRVKRAAAARLQFVLPPGSLATITDYAQRPRHYWLIHEAPVPPIPPAHRPADAFSKYCILWEVPKWEPRQPPDDPMLLRPLGSGLYVVLAHWDLTDIEKMVLGALLATQ